MKGLSIDTDFRRFDNEAAFADDGSLLGTVGLNIFLDQLPMALAQSVDDSLSGRAGGKAFNPATFVLTAANASIQVSKLI